MKKQVLRPLPKLGLITATNSYGQAAGYFDVLESLKKYPRQTGYMPTLLENSLSTPDDTIL